MTDLYFVRHCQSESNVIQVFAGTTDFDISEQGAKQLLCLREAFKDVHLDKVYSSPLIRARKTADALNFYPNAPVETRECFREMDMGDYETVPVHSMKENDLYLWKEHPERFVSPNGESTRHVAERAYEGLLKVCAENPGKTVAIATHGGVLRFLFRILKGLPEERTKEVPWSDNTAVYHVRYEDNGTFTILFENNTEHLPKELFSDWKD